ncbi:MAG: transposase [Planctomycetes bacterium]|nr:transposase [Planctomycetota bacterium]
MASTSPSASRPTSPGTRRGRRWRSKADRLAVAEAWVASGLDAAEFASQHGVTTSSLGRWRRELSKTDGAGVSGEFVEITVTPDVPTPSAIEVIVDGRHHVRVGPDFEELTLARVVRVLQSVVSS